jgi:hypothetical protein
MLPNGVKILGHASVLVTLDSYRTFNDQLMLQNMAMLREKLTKSNIKESSIITNADQHDLIKNLLKNHHN